MILFPRFCDLISAAPCRLDLLLSILYRLFNPTLAIIRQYYFLVLINRRLIRPSPSYPLLAWLAMEVSVLLVLLLIMHVAARSSILPFAGPAKEGKLRMAKAAV